MNRQSQEYGNQRERNEDNGELVKKQSIAASLDTVPFFTP